MRTVNIHDAKTHFSRLVEAAASGETIIIAKSGRPVAKLTRLDTPVAQPRRLGWYKNMPSVPDDFDEWMSEDVAALFAGEEPVTTESRE
ncbi:type II toxin-antitoxin system prevent-host-death family antitoxin [Humibacter ginsengiterrae]|jgi:prevent-host-death family protein